VLLGGGRKKKWEKMLEKEGIEEKDKRGRN